MSTTYPKQEKKPALSGNFKFSLTRIRRKCLQLSACLLPLLVFVPSVQALYDSDIVGNSGGGSFRIDCGEGSVLAGAAGSHVDYYGLQCLAPE